MNGSASLDSMLNLHFLQLAHCWKKFTAMGHDPQALDVDIDMVLASSFFWDTDIWYTDIYIYTQICCVKWIMTLANVGCLMMSNPRKAPFESGKWIEFWAACFAQYHSHWCTAKAGSFSSRVNQLVSWLKWITYQIRVILVDFTYQYMISFKSWAVWTKNPPFSVAFFPGWPPALRGKKWFTFHEQPLSGESRLALETLQRSGAFATLHAAVAYLQVKVRIGKDGSMKLEVVVCEWCKMWGTFPKTTVKRVFPNLEVAGWSLTEACDSSTFCAGSASFLLGGFETARIWVDFLCLNMSNLWSHFDFKGFPWEAPLRTTLWSWSRGLTLCCCSAEGGNRKSQWLICRRVLFVQKM